MRGSRTLIQGALAIAVSAACIATPLASAAQPSQAATDVSGYVVALQDEDIVVDLAAARGARSGDVVEIWRPLSLRHPVTKQVIKDRFQIGSLKLTQVRDTLSIARPQGTLARDVKAGDVVILRRGRQPSMAKLPEQLEPGSAPARPEPCPVAPDATDPDPDAAAVSALFDSLKNASIEVRIKRYEDYVRDKPEGRYAVVLYEEAAALRELYAFKLGKKSKEPPGLQNFSAPKEVLAGQPLSIALELSGAAQGAVLHARNAGEVAYQSYPMRRAGDGYYLVRLPADKLRAPTLQYFVEAVEADGSTVAVVGNAEEPLGTEVNAVPTPREPPPYEASATLLTDYADWNNLKNNDRVWQTEGSVGLRFRDVGVRAVRTGFGVYRGVGGTLEELDELKKAPRKVGLTYGYLEGEFGFSRFTSLVLRGVMGLGDDGVGGGAQALVRIGNDKDTNLMIGGEVLGGVGIRGITQLELNSIERFPIVFRTEVTNQPAGTSVNRESVRPQDGKSPDETSLGQGEVGARAIVQVGYRIVPELTLALRGSYQGRTINHAGPGIGGAVSYTW